TARWRSPRWPGSLGSGFLPPEAGGGRSPRPPPVARSYFVGRFTFRGPGQGFPLNAAWTQIFTVAFGPESVKSVKKLSGRFGKTVIPVLTVFSVTAGN